MNISNTFLPTAGHVGMLQEVTSYMLFVTVLAFLGGSLFFWSARASVLPEHRAGLTLHAIICAVAGLSYLKIWTDFQHLLPALAGAPSSGEKLSLIREGYVAIGQTRYMDWTVTTPLLLLATVLILRVRPRHVLAPVMTMLLADVFMILTGFIGTNQITAGGAVLQGPRLLWGTISTVGYLVVVYILFTRFRKYQRAATLEENHAFKLMALATVTTWGVYPIGYLIPAFFTNVNLNWLHVAFSVADIVNKVGVGVVGYWAAASVIEKLHPSQDNPAAAEEHPQST